jgi:hypothetical protein
MTDRRLQPFAFMYGGEILHGIAFGTEAERDAVLLELLGERPLAPSPRTQGAADVDRKPGRPSFDSLIDRVVAELGPCLDRRKPIAEQAARVLHHLAQRCSDPDLLPARRTVEIFLAARRSTRGKGTRKIKRGIRR